MKPVLFAAEMAEVDAAAQRQVAIEVLIERAGWAVARRAFEIGVVAASQGRHVRFFVAPNDAPCDACAMDAASGERLAGEVFPSGSAFPPLHAGCACAVIPV